MSVSSVDYLSSLAATSSAPAQRSAGNDFLEILQQEQRASQANALKPDTEPDDTDDVGASDRSQPVAEADHADADDADRSADAGDDRAHDQSDTGEPHEERAEADPDGAGDEVDAEAPADEAATSRQEGSEDEPGSDDTTGSSQTAGQAQPATDAAKVETMPQGTETASVPAGGDAVAPVPGVPETQPAGSTTPATGQPVDPNAVAGDPDAEATAGIDAGALASAGAAAAAETPAAVAGQAAANGSRAAAQTTNGTGPAGKPVASAGQADSQALAANAEGSADTGKRAGQDSLGGRGDWSSVAAEMAKAAQATSGTTRQSATFGSSQATADPSGSPVLGSTLTGTSLAKGTVLATARAANAASGANAADQVVVRIQRAVAEGVDRINLQLRPAQMGQVDIRLEVGADGRVQASITAERPETLQMLQRDARMLEQALQDAGLEADSGSLNFSLRDQGGEASNGDGRPGSSHPGSADGTETDDADGATLAASETTHRVTLGGVDVRV